MNRLHAALPTQIKKYVWNVKYGVLHYPRFVAPDDVVYYLSTRVFEHSSVLDLGCGRGSLLSALRAAGWTGNYCGVDISSRAISAARKVADQRSSWAVSDVESFRSSFKWDVITLIESLCYVKREEVSKVLTHLTGMLKPEGRLVIRLHDLVKYRDYIDLVYRLFPATEQVGANLFSIANLPK